MSHSEEIVFIASEIYPFSKSGGLADVMGILPLTLHRMGLKVSVITPLYGRISTSKYQLRLFSENCHVGYPWPSITANIYKADFEGMPVYFVDRGEYFDRRNYYCTHQGDYFDNCERFIFFCRAAINWIRRMDSPPRIIHANDWHAALAPVFLHFMRQHDPFWNATSSVLSIHNLAFQGQFSARLFFESGLPVQAWHMDGVEYYNSFNLLKGGIAYADAISTVSPTYAGEILTPEFGHGLEGILRKRSDRLWGILNGADYDVWSPGKDAFLTCKYSRTDIRGKKNCKHHLLESMGMDEELIDRPVLGFVGRLRRQKGIDLVLEIVPELMKRNLGLVILGEGNRVFEARLLDLVEQYRGKIGALVGYTEELSHKILAGSDLFLMPSRYEPCGLTQMYSLRYGTLPLANAVGGLRDTIVPYPDQHATGFIRSISTPQDLLEEVDMALEVWEQKRLWNQMQKRAMSADFSWAKSSIKYIEMYNELGNSFSPVVSGQSTDEGGSDEDAGHPG
jgi:starch synthase